MYTPTREAFIELAEQGNLIPVSREILADTDTPVSVFMKLDTGASGFLPSRVAWGLSKCPNRHRSRP